MTTSIAHIIRRRRRREKLRRQLQSQRRFWLLTSLLIVLLLVLGPAGIILGGVASAYAEAIGVLPDPRESVTLDPVIGATQIVDRAGTTLLFAVEDTQSDPRAWLTLDDLPDVLIEATLLTEDADFLTAARPDPLSTIALLWENRLRGPLGPDPTLTGRLVRATIAPPPEFGLTVDDRALEYALVAEINRRYSREEILEWHLNTNYYGQLAYGIESAAQIYLGKSARDLSVDEAALLAAIPTAPQYNPVDDEAAARSRQADLLRRLFAEGYLTPNQYETASATISPLRPDAGQSPLVAPEFAVYARNQAEDILDALGFDGGQRVARGGLRVTTTLDLDLYLQGECTLRAHLAQLRGDLAWESTPSLDGEVCAASLFLPVYEGSALGAGPDDGALVILNAQTGEILSMVGPAARAAYQPAATLYPFVYLEAFRTRLYSPATMVLDVNLTFPGPQEGLLYAPSNPDGEFRGPLSLRDAMNMGLTPPAAQVANENSLTDVLAIARRMGVRSLPEGLLYEVSLLERGGAVSALEMTQAYSVLASMGWITGVPLASEGSGQVVRQPVAVLKIEDAAGNVLWEYNPQDSVNRERFLPEALPYLINDILSDPRPRRQTLGLDNALEMPRPAAAVSAITSDRADNWTIGYTPQIVTAVRVGRSGPAASPAALELSPWAGEGAAMIWRALMEYTHMRDGLPVAEWERPEDIIEAQVCEISGLGPNGVCPVRVEIFEAQTPPLTLDTYYQAVAINRENGLRATASTSAALREEAIFFVPPAGPALEWWIASGRPLPPEQFDTVSRPDLFSSAVILQPERLAYLGGEVEVRGSLNAATLQYYTLAYSTATGADLINFSGQRTIAPVDGLLGLWDTTSVPDGSYNLYLRVVNQDNSIETSDPIPVIVDNTAPTVTLTAGEPGQTFTWGVDATIPLVAEVQDNYLIDRVEMFHNDQFYALREDCRVETCSFDFAINRTGLEIFTVVVYDGVGNSATTQITVEVVR